jgi:DNA polymerase-3 subunit delta'
MSTRMSDVWNRVVGQPQAVAELRAAAEAARSGGAGMTPSWLITGPAGSGRSVAALAFAAALECTDPDVAGCGVCHACHTVLAGTHPDVQVVRPEGLSISIKEARAMVVEASMAPQSAPYRVLLVEDADRLIIGTNDRTANVLLKAVEEPAPRTVFLLCAPSTVDVPATIRSRCRLVGLVTPAVDTVADVLRAEGVDGAMAAFAAQACAGHIGRARRLARDEGARARRADVLAIPSRLSSPAACLAAAADLHAACKAEGESVSASRDADERAALERSLGIEPGAKGQAARAAGAAIRELEKAQKSRATRAVRDAIDRALVDLAAWWRDVLVQQLGAGSATVVHGDQVAAQSRWVGRSTPEQTLRRIDAVLACRERIGANVAPLLALEAMCLELVMVASPSPRT